MKIEVGEYIRTKKGNIGKVLDITTCTGQKRKKYLIKWNIVKAYYITGTTIIKHSPNIIDLIEAGDYVNGEEVITVYGYDKDGNDKDELGICEVDDDYAYGVFLEDIPIRTIVTKEQFNNMEYRL